MKNDGYRIHEDDMGHCDLCASEKETPTGVTILIVTLRHGTLSLCEKHLVESSVVLQEIKNHGQS